MIRSVFGKLASLFCRHQLVRMATALIVTMAVIPPLVEVMSATPAAAYNLEGCRFAGYYPTYRIWGTAWRYTTQIVAAANSWTGTPTPIGLFRTTGSSYTILANAHTYGASGFDGITYMPSCSSGHWSSTVQTDLNMFYTNGYTFRGVQQVQAHEFGHALGLAHNNASCYILMYYSSTRYFSCGVYTPQQDDINGINALY